MSQTHTLSEDSPDDDDIFPFLVDAPNDRGQHILCKNLLPNLFEPGISPCKAEFPDVKIKRQIIDHYLKDICNLTQQYGIYTIFTNEVFAIIYSYISILENEIPIPSVSPTETSKHIKV